MKFSLATIIGAVAVSAIFLQLIVAAESLPRKETSLESSTGDNVQTPDRPSTRNERAIDDTYGRKRRRQPDENSEITTLPLPHPRPRPISILRPRPRPSSISRPRPTPSATPRPRPEKTPRPTKKKRVKKTRAPTPSPVAGSASGGGDSASPGPTAAVTTTADSTTVCPPPYGDPMPVPPGLVTLEWSSTLCVLVKGQRSVGDGDDGQNVQLTKMAPVARSHDNLPWRKSGGGFAERMLFGVDFVDVHDRNVDGMVSEDCVNNNQQMELERARSSHLRRLLSGDKRENFGSTSTIVLPPLNEEIGEGYYLMSFDHQISEKDKIARFLNRATFGATRAEIDNFPTSNLTPQSATQWIQSQIDEPPTFHRAWYRKRLNARSTRPEINFLPDHPCHVGSRWRSYTFSKKDGHQWWFTEGRTIKVTGDGPYVIHFAGHPRTTVDSFPWKSELPKVTIDPSMEYPITCWNFPEEWINGTWYMRAGDAMVCRGVLNPPIYFDTSKTELANPVVPLPAIGTGGFQIVDEQKIQSSGQEFILVDGLDHDVCSQLPDVINEEDPPIFGQTPDGTWLQFDPRYNVEENTAENPMRDGGGRLSRISNGIAQCSNVRRNVFNEHGCILSNEPMTCKGTADNLFIPIQLTAENIVIIYEITEAYPYAVKNLPLGGDGGAPIVSPCKKGAKTRWEILPQNECTQTDLDSQTYDALSSVLSQTQDDNEFVRDIVFPSTGASCSATYLDSLEEVSIIVETKCFKRVHPEHLSVFDLTLCTMDDNPCKLKLTNGDHPVKSPMDNDGSAFFDYQAQDNAFWDNQFSKLTKIGRLGDTIMFKDLSETTRLAKVAQHFGDAASQGQSYVVVCGSRNEVANDPSLGDFGFEIIQYFQNVDINPAAHRESVFFMIALEARDQLRQLMALQLSQLFAIVPLVLTGGWDHTENFLNFYDIFVRHGLENFREILREVTFSPLMAENLTFLDSKSGAYLFETTGSYSYADENYARELMQLFTVGVFLLNDDGTKKRNGDGEPIPTFSNDEVMSFARVFTGFGQSQPRGNFEENNPSLNALDELVVDPIYHDKFPKHDLTGGYIGDGYPLCVDLPSKMFLRKGATYRLLGGSPRPHAFIDEGTPTNGGPVRVLDLGGNSRLKEILCNSVDGSCQFPMTVTLASKINCDTVECRVDEARVVKVQDVYYEYIRPPCVEQVFFDNPKKVTYKNKFRHSSCANPLLPHAAEACCAEGNGSTLVATRYTEYVFDYERVTFSEADIRCGLDGLSQCDFHFAQGDSVIGLHWTNAPCQIAIKIDSEGKVAIVYDTIADIIHPNVHQDNMNYFKVYWNGDFPRNDMDEHGGNACGDGVCSPLEEGGCFCYTEVDIEAVFSQMPRSDEVLSKLYIGAYDPLAYDDDTFSKEFGEDVIAYLADGTYSSRTVFEVEDSFGRVRLLKNSIETVSVKNSEYSFRSVPSFMSLLNEETAERDALNEVDALIDHLLYHQNTASFIATRLIQRFVTSNPDPTYVSTVAKSFRTGKYGSLGSGKYGDLAATVSAILLEPSSLSVVLDTDPHHGSIREPLIKALHVLRSMEIKLENGKQILENHFPFRERLFQMAHSFPSVFSFFLPENIPSGRPGDAELTSPEAMLIDMPKVIGMLNGLFSTIKYGVSRCNNGFGRGENESNCQEGIFSEAAARLSFDSQFSDANDVVTELSTLLTGGRLGAQNKQIVIEAYESKLPDKDAAMRIAQQLIISSPEFQSSNTIIKNGQPRLPGADPEPKGVPYKAVVYVMLAGGADSFNMLVPVGCSTYNDYIKIRNGVEQRTNSLIQIDATDSNQPCSFYGLHSKLKNVEGLYNDKDLLFFANAGVLTKPTDKLNYSKDTLSRLFAHNHMQREIQHVDPYLVDARTGVLGRMSDVLSRNGFRVHRFNIHDRSEGLEGKQRPDPFIVDANGIPLFNENPSATDMLEKIKELNEVTKQESNVFADFWSDSLMSAMTSNAFLTSALANVQISSSFGDDDLGKGMEMIVKLIATRDVRKVDRDFFFISMGGWDAHKKLDNNLNKNLDTFDKALGSFVSELRLMGVWESVTILQASEFGRTLEANGVKGTDHGWGGNYMMTGGSVKGRQILGKYPEVLSSNAPEILDRGRVLPTTSWDVILSAIAEWTGVPPESLNDVCPNLDNFPKSDRFDVDDLYHTI